ncbi:MULTISPECIES: RHS repeat-associated core domain-containing protein [Pseudomonas]|nr:hypothetical protein [Pseudomonas monteilii]MBV4516515.1 RHS repeat-associated core domain-containing protein [Pseudomonas kurunegalensis]MBZ3665653.1 hypothetical protein [Pseudomonas monteilii]MBZ3670997.1 hypothetical protein [Pseudomonas monteilii]MCA4075378.1 RHS repeat-associated core domain-containing protein [Pseudomonas kurunegalensis]
MKKYVEKLFYEGRSLVCQVGTAHTRLLYANDRLLSQQRERAGLVQTIGRNSVVAVWESGILTREAYSPYGASSSGQALTPVGFNGQWRDVLMDSYPLGQGKRLYRPRLMRFLAPDSQSPFDRGGMNAYCYCSADPINFHDPSGEAHVKILGVKLPLRVSSGLGKALRANDLPTLSKRSVRDSLMHDLSSEFASGRANSPSLIIVPARKDESNTFTYRGNRYRFTPAEMVSSSHHVTGTKANYVPVSPSAPSWLSQPAGSGDAIREPATPSAPPLSPSAVRALRSGQTDN